MSSHTDFNYIFSPGLSLGSSDLLDCSAGRAGNDFSAATPLIQAFISEEPRLVVW